MADENKKTTPKRKTEPKDTVLYLFEIQGTWQRNEEQALPVSMLCLSLQEAPTPDLFYILNAHWMQPRQRPSYQKSKRLWDKKIEELIHEVLLFDVPSFQAGQFIVGNTTNIGQTKVKKSIAELLSTSMAGSFLDY